MRLTVKTLFFILLFSSLAYAIEVCQKVDTTGLTDDEKKKIDLAAYFIAIDQGQTIEPRYNRLTEIICFDDPIFSIPVAITPVTLHNKIVTLDTQAQINITQINNWRIELNDLQTQITSDYANWDTLTTTQKLAISKKVVRIQDLKKKLNE